MMSKYFLVIGMLYIAPFVGITQTKPNIIFVLADDLGWADLGSYGNKFNETPNLDALATSGKKFTRAYAAAAVCSPTRASIVTGQYPARIGITDFLGGSPGRYLVPDKYTTINEALSKEGYHTGIVGKWHLDTDYRTPKGSPKLHGFDEVIGSETKYIADGDYFFPYDKIDTYVEGVKNEYLTDRQNQDACDFIRRNKEKPFFLYLSYYSVHTKLVAPKSTVDKYKAKFNAKYGKGSADRIFDKNPRHEVDHLDNPYLAAMIEHIDNGIGMIMKTLAESGLDKNTIIVFTSDNGGAPNVANNGNLRGYKSWLYEGGIRVPLLFHWPGRVKTGEEHESVSSIDFYPTFVAAAGGDVKNYTLDGENLLPLLTEDAKINRKELFWHYPAETLKPTNRMSTVVLQGDYKLIKFYLDNRYELYDLKKDPSEKKNLSEKKPDKTNELSAIMERWLKEVNAEKADAAALEQARSSVTRQVNERMNVFSGELGLSVTQYQDVHKAIHTYLQNEEELRKRPEQNKKARDKNALEREAKLRETLSPEQWKKLMELRRKERLQSKK